MTLNSENLNALCLVAITAAKDAGNYIESNVGGNFKQDSKGSHLTKASQVVTEVDVRAQEIILKQLRESIKAYDLGLLTEESTDDESRLTKDYFWCVDPMDGTLAFTEGKSGYAVSISLISQAGNPVIGVVYIPDLEDCYSAIYAEGVKLNGEPFQRIEKKSGTLHCYMDRSFPAENYYASVQAQMEEFASDQLGARLELHIGFGAVRNAVAVMASAQSCYFKFPKNKAGGGSIWDFGATRLFFEELRLPVSTFGGETLLLNTPETTFMGRLGVLYASSYDLADGIRQISSSILK